MTHRTINPTTLWPLLLLGALTLFVSGCGTAAPAVPDGWAVHTDADAGDGQASYLDGAAPTRLQVIVCYGPVIQSHAAIRIEDGRDRVVYWDPGGDFGRRDPHFNRTRDVMTGPHATLQRIWHYRRSECGNDSMAVYEFELPPRDLRRLQDLLVASAREPEGPGAFATETAPSQCTKTVCKFLQQYTPDRPNIPERWLYPHELGTHLWTQGPDRVILYREHQRPVVVVPVGDRTNRPTLPTVLR